MWSDFVSVGVEILNLGVIRPFVGNVESGGNGATVRVDSSAFEQFGVETFVEVVDGIVEGQKYELRNFLNVEAACKEK